MGNIRKVPSLQILSKLNKAVYKQIMWMIVRETYYQLTLASWDSNKLTHPLQDNLITSARADFEPEQKESEWWLVMAVHWGMIKFWFYINIIRLFGKENNFSGFRTDVGNLKVLKSSFKFWAFTGNCKLYSYNLHLPYLSLSSAS